MRTITKTYYSFSELTEEQKKIVIEKYPERFSPHDAWYEVTIEGIKEALEKIGFSDVAIGFSGFWSQGDGAHFTGNYRYKKGALKEVKKEYPKWGDLHCLVKELQKLERQYFYNIRFSITHSGHYSHEMCTSFGFEDVRHNHGWTPEGFKEDEWEDVCRCFMQTIYSDLEKEYEYLQSEEYVLENSECFDHLEFSDNELN